MKERRPLISVIGPAFNESENIVPFYDRLVAATEDADYDLEILFVDDGSTDDSLARIKELIDRDLRVRVLKLSRNFGGFNAVIAGLDHARGDAVMVVSVDLQDPPELIRDFVAEWRQGVDTVWGVRASRQDPLLKKLFARTFYWLLRKLAFPDFPEDGMDYGLFDRRVIDAYRRLPERTGTPFYSIYSLGFRQARIPYVRQKRVAHESGWPFWRRVANAIDTITTYSYTPIRMISLIGFLASGLGLLYALVIIVEWFLHGFTIPGWPTLIVLILVLGGLQIMVLGVIAEYVFIGNKNTRQRPRYIVMEIHGESVPIPAPDSLGAGFAALRDEGADTNKTE